MSAWERPSYPPVSRNLYPRSTRRDDRVGKSRMLSRALAAGLAAFVLPIAFGAAFQDLAAEPIPVAPAALRADVPAPATVTVQAFQEDDSLAAYGSTQSRVDLDPVLRNPVTPPTEASAAPEVCPPDM